MITLGFIAAITNYCEFSDLKWYLSSQSCIRQKSGCSSARSLTSQYPVSRYCVGRAVRLSGSLRLKGAQIQSWPDSPSWSYRTEVPVSLLAVRRRLIWCSWLLAFLSCFPCGFCLQQWLDLSVESVSCFPNFSSFLFHDLPQILLLSHSTIKGWCDYTLPIQIIRNNLPILKSVE